MSAVSHDATAVEDVQLTDVMLAMDVVDSLRHEESLVNRALNADERERVLLERVRDAYAAQGIEVSPETLAAGVQALAEREFQYTPPPDGVATRFFRAWTRRASIGKGIGVIALIAGVIGGGYYGFVERPAAARLAASATELNTKIDLAGVDIRTLDQRRLSLSEALTEARKISQPQAVELAAARSLDQAEAAIDDAARSLQDASALAQTGRFNADNMDTIGATGRAQLDNQLRLLATAETELDAAETAVAAVRELAQLPARLASIRDEAAALAVPTSADRDIAELFAAGMTALSQGDAASAAQRVTDLEDVLAELEQSYDISVVSRPGERSGVIRAPESNLAANNYYLIVEALDRSGRALTVQVRSQEDGSVRRVRAWGIRVGQSVFERIRADKEDDGIIQSRVVGRKERGYLDPTYRIDVDDGLIHQW